MSGWDKLPLVQQPAAPQAVSGWDRLPVAGAAPAVQGIPGGGPLPPANPPSEDDLRAQDAAIIKARGQDPSVVMRAHNYHPGDVTRFIQQLALPATERGQEGMALTQASNDGSFIGRVVHGAGDVGSALDRGATWLQSKLGYKDADADLAYKDLLGGIIEQDYKHPGGVDWGRLLGQTAAAAPLLPGGGKVTGPMAATTRAANVGKTMATGAGMAAVQPDATPGSVAVGAAAAPILQAGGEKIIDKVVGPAVQWMGNKAAAALAGTKLGDRLGIPADFTGKVVNPKYAGAPELSTELDQAGITAHDLADVTSDPKLLRQQAMLARTDPRFMDRKILENQQALAYGEKVVGDLQDAVKAEKWTNLADVEAAAQAGGKRAKQAQVILDAVNNMGDDWKRIAQTSGNLELMVRKLRADQLYDTAEKIAGLYGDVTPTNFKASLESAIRRIQGNQANDQTLVPKLQAILGDVEAGKNLGFGGMRETRTILNQMVEGLNKPNTAVQDVKAAREALGGVVGGIEADLEKFGNSHSSGLRNAWKKATDYYRDNVVPYKDAEVGKLLADQDPLALGRLFAQKDPYSQQKLWPLLGAKGQAAVRSGIIEDALAAGEKTQRGVLAPTFSAAKAASALEKLASDGTMKTAFGTEDRWAATGLARILRTVDNSDTVAFVPKTGEVSEGIGKAIKGDLTIMGTLQLAYSWLSKDRLYNLLTDPKGKALLVQASELRPGSKAMLNLIDKLNSQLPKLAGVSAGRAMGTPQTTPQETPNADGASPR